MIFTTSPASISNCPTISEGATVAVKASSARGGDGRGMGVGWGGRRWREEGSVAYKSTPRVAARRFFLKQNLGSCFVVPFFFSFFFPQRHNVVRRGKVSRVSCHQEGVEIRVIIRRVGEGKKARVDEIL